MVCPSASAFANQRDVLIVAALSLTSAVLKCISKCVCKFICKFISKSICKCVSKFISECVCKFISKCVSLQDKRDQCRLESLGCCSISPPNSPSPSSQ